MNTKLFVAFALCVLMAGVASADLVDDSTGMVNGWGVTPFSIGGVVHVSAGMYAFTLENNYAPINYPSGVGHVPSPGGADGERIDLEEMYVQVTGTQLKVLVVTSSAYAACFSGQNYYLGDLFLTLDGNVYGIVTQNASQGLAAGSIYSIGSASDVVALQPGSRSYYNYDNLYDNDYGDPATVRDVAGPWAVASGIDGSQLLGSAAIASDVYSYGGIEDNTFVIEYTMDLALLGGLPETLNAHITWGCGNDVIEANSTIVPEPATMALLGFGMGLIVIRRRKA
ncbi:MAG: PEP-CTERM sorting domain-containing protein [Planctomycetes bacterium]|nr:PEP-CTERM sorting domain-containing protein [Planctomycetota bacterium]